MPGVTAWPTVQETHVEPGPSSLSAAATAGGPSTELWSSGVLWSAPPGGDGGVLPALTVGSVVTATVLVAWNRTSDPSRTARWRAEGLSGPTRMSLAFAGLGIASLAGWLLRGGVRSSPLLYFGGIGLFGAVLVSLLLPRRTIPPVVAEGLHKALVSTAGGPPGADRGSRSAVYYPGSDATDPQAVRVSTSERAALDAGSDRTAAGSDGPFRSQPSGAVLYETFRTEATTDLGTDSETFAWQLCQALTDWFELVSSATPAAEDAGEVTVRVAESAVPDVEMFDHPVVSFLGVAFACKRNRPVVATVQPGDAAAEEYRISVHPITTDSPETPVLNSAVHNGSHDDTNNR